MTTKKVQHFVSWAFKTLADLRDKTAEEVAEAVGDAILKIDQRLGIEVSEPCEEADREVIVTAYSDPSLFPVVREIVHRLSDVKGWRFVALKPPRGFDFNISVGQHEMQADTLEFASVPNILDGIQLLVPHVVTESLLPESDAEELAWLIVETGIGEELTSRLQHIEFSSRERINDRQSITKLAAFVKGGESKRER